MAQMAEIPTRRRPGPLRRLTVSGLVLCGTIVVTTMLFEESMTFYPSPWPAWLTDLGAIASGGGCDVEERRIDTDDEIVPVSTGWRLCEAATEPKAFHRVGGAGHNDTFEVGGAFRLGAFADFVERCARAAGGAA